MIFHIVSGGPVTLRGKDFSLEDPYISVFPTYEGKHPRDLRPGETCTGRQGTATYTVLRFK